jgi:hypothetical protein
MNTTTSDKKVSIKNKADFMAAIKLPKDVHIEFRNIRINDKEWQAGIVFRMVLHNRAYQTETLAATSSNYTAKNVEAINSFVASHKEIFEGFCKQHKEYLRSQEGKKMLAYADAKALAQKAGLQHDEHGGYGRGDYHTLVVQDVVSNMKQLKKLFSAGKILALVEDSRKRVYSKKYMASFGGGHRSDKYLVGTNENGIPFAHGVSKACASVEQAVTWIWGGATTTARHGDVAIAPSNLSEKTQGEKVSDATIHDSHHFSGEMHKNGSVHVRNGTLHHTKNQHPDVVIGAQWQRIAIAKRAAVGGSRD